MTALALGGRPTWQLERAVLLAREQTKMARTLTEPVVSFMMNTHPGWDRSPRESVRDSVGTGLLPL
jgi:hypothetical protein